METVEMDSFASLTWKQVRYLGLLFDKTWLSDHEKSEYWNKVTEAGFARDVASAVITELVEQRKNLDPEDY